MRVWFEQECLLKIIYKQIVDKSFELNKFN